jgi:glycosyltransferase XagB
MLVQDTAQTAADGAVPDQRAGLLHLLRKAGVSAAQLASAVWQADRLGVDVVHYILAEGLVDERFFYQQVALHLGLPFQDRPLQTASIAQPEYAIQSGLCPLWIRPGQPLNFALAPKGALLQRLLAQDLRGRRDLVVMTPSCLAQSVRRSHVLHMARHAAGLDPVGQERRSARSGLSFGQFSVLGLLVLTLSFSVTLEPFAALTAIAFGAWPIFIAMAGLRLAVLFNSDSPAQATRAAPSALPDHELPVYSVIVPLYREAAVLAQLLAALDALDYPRAKLDIRIVIEHDDDETRQAMARTPMPPHIKVLMMPPGQPRTKPRALNAALLEATGALVTIFDAEDIPDPQQLRDAADAFASSDATLACLQAHLVVDNGGDGWLARCFALEYAGLFDVINPGLLERRLPILLGGTSNHFRISAVRHVGGWDAWNVTEDADLGIRLLRAGYRIEDLDSATYEEAPARLDLWFRQRTRWMKGYMQTVATHTNRPLALLRETGPMATLILIILMLGTIVSALGYPFCLVVMVMWGLGLFATDLSTWGGIALSGLSLLVFVVGLSAMILPPAIGAVRRRSFDLLPALPLLPLYYALVSLAAWRALADCVFTPFKWNKTQHGLARTSPRRQSLTNASATPLQTGPADAQDSGHQ